MTDLASQPTISETAAPRPGTTLWQAVVLVAVTLLAYFPVTSAGFIWNDDDLTAILKLIDQGGLSAVWFSSEAFNYWPMTWTSYWIEHQLFGTDPATGVLTLADEVLTSDSSRYWDAELYAAGGPDRLASFDKQIVRNWLASNWDRTGTPPTLPPEIVERTAARYRELLARLTA
jgi:hypothetical protein